jgi:hypothetical protein
MHGKLVIRDETWLRLIVATLELSLVPLGLAELGIVSWEALVSRVGVVVHSGVISGVESLSVLSFNLVDVCVTLIVL